MLHGGKWSKGNEAEIVAMRDLMVREALGRGRNVVVDDTNYHSSHAIALGTIAMEMKAEFELKDFDTDVEECIKRDLHRGDKAVGEQVIRKMWRQYVEPVRPRFVGQKEAVIFDIDGTLAIMTNRGPFEWEKVGNDLVNEEVKNLLNLYRNAGVSILIFSGRDGVCRSETLEWLERNDLPWTEFRMRGEGDNRKDVEVKREFLYELREKYDIKWAVDDRPQVCRMWHTEGICLLKVGDPDLEF